MNSPLHADIAAMQQNGITRIAAKRLDDPKVIPLWFGEGDIATDESIRNAAKRALDDGDTFYDYPQGRRDLCLAIKRYLDGLYGIDLDPVRVVVPGSTMLGITIAARMGLGHGDHALIVSPNWPNIENSYRATGADFDFVRQRQGRDGWFLSMDDLRAALRPNTRSIFVNTPCNPTGWVMPAEQQAELLEICRERNILLIADEVYHRNIFDEREAAPSFLSLARNEDPVVVVSGFSKAWAMTGWRIGWAVGPAHFAKAWAVLCECYNTGATVFVQQAAIGALEEKEVVARLRAQYTRGRKITQEILGSCRRLEFTPPQGAFYAFPRLPGLRSSFALAEGILEEEDVGIAPGYTFGPGNEECFRICFAMSHDRLRNGLERVVRYIERHADSLTSGST
ncbi:MAG: aminotransferase class I/II-fold pyridoxal phosphate-dependent enzyme [Ectothiorhodospiraceae bacterium AqS1]|nr:aminotransferase class I/II-fold pyridoxal phosphate-dependent enzyme [Ectothiorhodospiraceae bacterium AqS1]